MCILPRRAHFEFFCTLSPALFSLFCIHAPPMFFSLRLTCVVAGFDLRLVYFSFVAPPVASLLRAEQDAWSRIRLFTVTLEVLDDSRSYLSSSALSSTCSFRRRLYSEIAIVQEQGTSPRQCPKRTSTKSNPSNSDYVPSGKSHVIALHVDLDSYNRKPIGLRYMLSIFCMR
jgi:hypothetical protein